jgi:hypothetical protein
VWTDALRENEKSMQKRYWRSCMLSNVIVGIVVWLAMNRGFSSIHRHVACGLCRKTMWSQNRNMIFRAKDFILIIIWNASDFFVVERLPNDAKMNSCYFVRNILIQLKQTIVFRGMAPYQKRFVFHLDNCSVHTSRDSTDWLEEHGIRRMLHSPYSSDLALSDFYLFPTVKEKLERTQVANQDQFFTVVLSALKAPIGRRIIYNLQVALF